MAWESRKSGGRYYTRSKRVSGRIVRQYVGAGPLAELAYRRDLAERAEREAQRLAFEAVRNRDSEFDDELDSFSKLAEAVARGLLAASGYHQHKRGAWRKRYEQNQAE